MLRLIAFFAYMISYLIYSIPKLIKLKKLKLNENLSVAEKDELIHKTPQKWSQTIMKITGSKVSVIGQENIPAGGVLFISNHEGDFDIPVLLANIDKPFGFISKVEVKKAPILSDWMEVMNCVFLDRKNRRSAVNMVKRATELLKEGHSIVLFPEGTRSQGGPIGEFKPGGFRMAIDAQVPIVPITIKGTADVFEKNGRLIKPAEIRIVIDKPIQPNLPVKELAEVTREKILSNHDSRPAAS